ncbi:MAG: tetratricopeptide repeat protein [Gemmatimonadaceae bacterium]
MRFLLLLGIPALLGAQTPEQLFLDGRLADARIAFQARLAQDRNDANAMYHLGRIAHAENTLGEATRWFERAVKGDGSNALYHLWLGNALGEGASSASKVRQPFIARRVKSEFEKAVQLDPTLVAARMGLVDFYSVAPGFMGGSMDKAREQASVIVTLNAMRGHLAYARLAQRASDPAAEEVAYGAAIAAAPDSTQPYYALGAMLRRQQRWDEAFAAYDRLIVARPDDVTARALWGITAGQSGMHLERGERELKFYLANLPANAAPVTISAVHYRMGQIYVATGRQPLARVEYQAALNANPRNGPAKAALDSLR